jgi:hypothetical protein
MFDCASTVSKHFFIITTDTHNYKITGMLKTIKIPIIASTCFDSRGNHHQGAISCLAKTTIMILLCSSLMTWSMSWRHTSLLCKRAVHGTGRQCLPVPCTARSYICSCIPDSQLYRITRTNPGPSRKPSTNLYDIYHC